MIKYESFFSFFLRCSLNYGHISKFSLPNITMIIQPLKYIVTNHSIVYNVRKLQIDYIIVCLYTCDHLIGKNQFSSREYIFHFLLILLKTKDG